MPKVKNNPELLKKKERVRAAVDMRGVPEGADGTVLMSVGIDWVRYWVHWDNGEQMGSIHRDKLVRLHEWDAFLVEREEAALQAASASEASADAGGGEAAAAGGGDGAVINGVQIPQLLLDRTKAALERFGVSR